jgi:hypothetical protein
MAPRREQNQNPLIRSLNRPTRHETGSGYDMRRLCATVLIFEAIVIGLAIPVAVKVGHVSAGSAGPAGGALAGAAVVIAIAMSVRSIGLPGLRIALVTGSILQLVMIASGALVPVMYALGVIFGALWTVAILLGRSAERAAPR